MILSIFLPEWMERLGWVLLHFLWQGGLIGILTLLGLGFFKKSSAQSRYLFLCVALLSCLLLPCLTWTLLGRDTRPHLAAMANQGFESFQSHLVTTHSPLTTNSIVPPMPSAPAASPSSILPLSHIEHSINRALPYLVIFWSLGVILLSLRTLYAWLQLRHFCISGIPVQDHIWVERLNTLAERMGIGQTVSILESILIEVPTVMGWLRPVILVPTTFLTGLPADQIEAILAHELAHIRRHDYFANLIQITVETLLFYHPVVWWISRSIREERENCCDDLALNVLGDKALYVTALASLEESRSLPRAITLSATGGSLLKRIRRILGAERRKNFSWLFVVIILSICAIGSWVVWEANCHADEIALLIQHKGSLVYGTVSDEKGHPISGVHVAFGEAGAGSLPGPSTKTDSKGRFHFVGLPTEKSYLNRILTFTSPNYAPEMVNLETATIAQPLKVILKSGKRLQMRFVDKQGNPVQGVTLVARGWRGHEPFHYRSIRFESDKNGMVIWEHAPEEPVTYMLDADKFLQESPTLKPTEGVQTFQLKLPTVVSGHVLDAVTKKPIMQYHLVFGTYYPEHHPDYGGWAHNAAIPYHTDFYRYVFDRPAEMNNQDGRGVQAEGFHRIRIEAPGYEAGVSRPIANNEESVAIDFELKPAAAIHGLVTAEDGTPVKNAQIVVAGPGNAVMITDGVYRDSSRQQIIRSKERGEYDLPAQEEDYPIAIVQPDMGYFTTTYKALKAAPNVQLLSWGEIDLTSTTVSTTNRLYHVSYWNKKGPPYHGQKIIFENARPTKPQGDPVIFKHLVAGPVWLGVFMGGIQNGSAVQVENGQTTKVDWKTGKTGVVGTDGKIRDGGNPAATVIAQFFPNLAADQKKESQTMNSGAKSTDANPTKTLSIQVIDQQGNPIQGASVKPTGLRTREDPRSWYGIRPQDKHFFQSGTTDAEGKASVSFPSHTADKLTTGTVIVLVQHPEVCSAAVEVNLDFPKPVTLVRGTKVMLSPQPLPCISFSRIEADIVDGKRQSRWQKWTPSPDGLSVSAHLPDGNYLVRLVAMTPQGKIYFSDSVPFSLLAKTENGKNPQSGDFDLKKSFVMHEGGMVKGVLDPSVPRPVKGGWIASCVSSPHPASDYGNSFINTWFTSADVAEDGSFMLTNLPAGSLEIVAGCDGYVSKDESGHFFTGIHQARLIGQDRDQQLSVPMEKTGEVRVEVQTPDGKPLSGATVGFSPNQGMGNCNGLLGARFNSAEMLSQQETDAATTAKQQPASLPFHAKTDASGVALIKGLPVGEQICSVTSDAYDMPFEILAPPNVPRRQRTVTVPDNVTVKMESRTSEGK